MGEELDHSPGRDDDLFDAEDALCILTQDNVEAVGEEPLEVSSETLEVPAHSL
ncbi:hypothetical protein PHLCEN_2v4749 [Hermanssonia centrifuga]|uniref:Uncharacterized protein n=1 Tax=Hermanssonia centrifuga TaxID=98765 RepID=A0A2R6PJA1_9APHY|nr:hypothetical protein PHLCEN_2v4749 [Hermanssonia centrifuga]